jgi:hypothetical protein
MSDLNTNSDVSSVTNSILHLPLLSNNISNQTSLEELNRRLEETLISIENDSDFDSDNESDSLSLDQKQNDMKEQCQIVELFSYKWNKTLMDKINKNNLTYADVRLENIHVINMHGLSFYACYISYDVTSRKYGVDFKINKYVDGLINKNNKDQFMFRSLDFSLKKALLDGLERINQYIFCIHCGYIVKEEQYMFEKKKCDSCLLTDLLAVKKEKGDYCSICHDDCKNSYALPCGHKFHRACLSKCVHKICPLCRKSMNED